MNVSFQKTVIEVSAEEAIDLYYALKRAIENSIDTHWHNHPDAYEKNEARRLQMLTQLSRSVGHDIDPIAELKARLVAAVAKKKGGAS